MNAAKIQFSKEELAMAGDAGLILTKNSIIQKMVMLFSVLAQSMQEAVKSKSALLPSPFLTSEPRISKGEQYQSLPWVMLDYPRVFGKEDIFAIRTLFWWGNDCSVTLHLRGAWLEAGVAALEKAFLRGELKDFHFTVGEEEWRHHLEAGSHQSLGGLPVPDWQVLLQDRDFVKLRLGIPLATWDWQEARLLAAFKTLMQVFLNVSYPGGERVP